MRKLTKYGAVLKTTLLSNLVYGRDVAMRAVFMAVVLFIFLQLWSTTFSITGASDIAGFTLRDLVWYLVLTETVVLSAPRVSFKIDQEVKAGDLAYVLAKPYHYVLYHLAAYGGEAALRVPINFAIGAAVAAASVGLPTVSPVAVAAASVSLMLALVLNFAIEAAIGLTAFWVEDTVPFYWIYQKLTFSVGGLFLPLELFPRLLEVISRGLPFAGVTYAPARLFVGFSWADFASFAALQLGWILALGCVALLVYSNAVRRVNVHGG